MPSWRFVVPSARKMRRAHRSYTRLACREERRAAAMARSSSGSLRADSLVFTPGAWSAEEIGVRKRLGRCAEQLAGADALPEAALRAVVREVRAALVALGLPRDDNTATREIFGGAHVENFAPTPESRDACGHAGAPPHADKRNFLLNFSRRVLGRSPTRRVFVW